MWGMKVVRGVENGWEVLEVMGWICGGVEGGKKGDGRRKNNSLFKVLI